MKKLLAGSLALALTSAGAIGWAGVSSAQLPEPQLVQLDATLSADVVDPGQSITATGEPCTAEAGGEGVLGWFWEDAQDQNPSSEGQLVPLGEDGSWEVTFTAPSEPGEYWFVGDCMPLGLDAYVAEAVACLEMEAGDVAAAASEHGGDHDPPPAEEPEFDCVFEYAEVLFTVAGEAPPEGPVGPGPGPRAAKPQAAVPATPVRGNPNFTG